VFKNSLCLVAEFVHLAWSPFLVTELGHPLNVWSGCGGALFGDLRSIPNQAEFNGNQRSKPFLLSVPLAPLRSFVQGSLVAEVIHDDILPDLQAIFMTALH